MIPLIVLFKHQARADQLSIHQMSKIQPRLIKHHQNLNTGQTRSAAPISQSLEDEAASFRSIESIQQAINHDMAAFTAESHGNFDNFFASVMNSPKRDEFFESDNSNFNTSQPAKRKTYEKVQSVMHSPEADPFYSSYTRADQPTKRKTFEKVTSVMNSPKNSDPFFDTIEIPKIPTSKSNNISNDTENIYGNFNAVNSVIQTAKADLAAGNFEKVENSLAGKNTLKNLKNRGRGSVGGLH